MELLAAPCSFRQVVDIVMRHHNAKVGRFRFVDARDRLDQSCRIPRRQSMRLLFVTVLAAGLGFGTLLLAGCNATGGSGSAGGTHNVISGMMCPGCETVWVRDSKVPSKYNRMTSSKKMTCETCDTTAQAVLAKDGKVQLHNCPSCKVTPVLVDHDRPKHDHRKTK